MHTIKICIAPSFSSPQYLTQIKYKVKKWSLFKQQCAKKHSDEPSCNMCMFFDRKFLTTQLQTTHIGSHSFHILISSRNFISKLQDLIWISTKKSKVCFALSHMLLLLCTVTYRKNKRSESSMIFYQYVIDGTVSVWMNLSFIRSFTDKIIVVPSCPSRHNINFSPVGFKKT